MLLYGFILSKTAKVSSSNTLLFFYLVCFVIYNVIYDIVDLDFLEAKQGPAAENPNSFTNLDAQIVEVLDAVLSKRAVCDGVISCSKRNTRGRSAFSSSFASTVLDFFRIVYNHQITNSALQFCR